MTKPSGAIRGTAQRFSHYTLITVSIVLLGACASRTTFEYTLQAESEHTGLATPLSIRIADDSIEFSVVFQGGGGENDSARLSRNDKTLKVILLNVDHISEKMLVLYRLSGTIRNLESGSYTLQVQDSTGRVVAEQPFDVP